jgi:nitroreductase
MNVKEAIEIRRAYRSFDKIEIMKDLVKDLANMARIAPSCNNSQPWKFVFVYDENQLNKLFTSLTSKNNWVQKASMIIGVFSTPQDDCIIKERMYYLFDTGLATAFIILRATELGLVAHPIAGFDEELAKEILKIPKDMRLITLVIIGKHSNEINPVLSELMKLGEKNRPPRKDIGEFAFKDFYGNPLEK